MNTLNYGIDAHKVIIRLFVIGVFLTLTSIFFPVIKIGSLEIIMSGFIWTGLFLVLAGILMILYAKFGKFRHRDRILNLIKWNGSENVLDIGTGLGLLAIAAAKKLTTGKAVGIDIFDVRDLSNNTIEQTKANSKLENVETKVEILKIDILKNGFPDDFFDVIVSNLCLHNINKSENRKTACAEIHGILKPGAKAIISDFIKIGEYTKTFKNL